MQKNSYSQAVMTPFGRPSIANQLRDNAILQLYLKTTNMYLAIDRHGNVINTANGNDKGSKYSLICEGESFCVKVPVSCNTSHNSRSCLTQSHLFFLSLSSLFCPERPWNGYLLPAQQGLPWLLPENGQLCPTGQGNYHLLLQ